MPALIFGPAALFRVLPFFLFSRNHQQITELLISGADAN